MRADQHRRQRLVAPGPPGEDVADTVYRDAQSGLLAPAYEQFAHGAVVVAQCQAPEAAARTFADLSGGLDRAP
jgi:hypothetical protein